MCLSASGKGAGGMRAAEEATRANGALPTPTRPGSNGQVFEPPLGDVWTVLEGSVPSEMHLAVLGPL